MRITRCTPDDLDDLVWIARKTFRETFAGQNTVKDMAAYLASAISPKKLAAELRCPDSALFLARDNFGIKPMHYTLLPDGDLLFGSEIKSLLAHPDFLANELAKGGKSAQRAQLCIDSGFAPAEALPKA